MAISELFAQPDKNVGGNEAGSISSHVRTCVPCSHHTTMGTGSQPDSKNGWLEIEPGGRKGEGEGEEGALRWTNMGVTIPLKDIT